VTDERSPLHVNHEYLLEWAARAGRGASTLDFGCGAGEVVRAGRARGLDVRGVDTFEGRPERRDALAERGLLGAAVREIGDDGRIPFPDETFDLVVANQVFEHVRDFDPPLDEIARVLRPGGLVLALFPSRGVLREGHVGIPLAHWFPPGAARSRFVLAMRSLGLGYDRWGRGSSSAAEWTRRATDYLRDHTFYRSRRAALASFEVRFRVRSIEDDYIAFRLRGRPLAAALNLPLARPAARVAMRLVAGMVVLGTRA
jgi:SAM-dependent methyltransferase